MNPLDRQSPRGGNLQGQNWIDKIQYTVEAGRGGAAPDL